MSTTTTEVKPATEKKEKGFLGYINEKLTEWPLWTKLTSYLSSDNPEEVKKEEAKKDQTKPLERKPMKLKELPWTLFMGRDRFQPVYDYYHCKEDNTTYFYQMARQRISYDSSIAEMSK